MTEHTETSEPDFVGVAFAHALRGEPVLGLDVITIEQRGRRRLFRRRLAVTAGAGLAVVTLTAGIAFGAAGVVSSTNQAPMAAVPGCGTVLRTTDPAMLSWMHDGRIPSQTPAQAGVEITAAEAGPGDASTVDEYQPPAWFTPEKATTMQAALAAALPSGITLEPTADNIPLPFTERPDGVGFLGGTHAELSIQSQPWDRGAPPCTEVLSLRYIAPDGTVADVITSGTQGEGEQFTAEAFHPDGTLVSAMLSWYPSESTSTPGLLPMTEQELAMLVADQAFAIS